MEKIVRIKLLMLALLIVLVITGCATQSTAGEHNPFEDRFAVVSTINNTIKVIIDRTTGVCYLWRKSGYGAGMTVLLDADGTPLTYEEAWYQTYQEESKQ